MSVCFLFLIIPVINFTYKTVKKHISDFPGLFRRKLLPLIGSIDESNIIFKKLLHFLILLLALTNCLTGLVASDPENAEDADRFSDGSSIEVF